MIIFGRQATVIVFNYQIIYGSVSIRAMLISATSRNYFKESRLVLNDTEIILRKQSTVVLNDTVLSGCRP